MNWINTADQLPEDGIRVVAFDKFGGVCTCILEDGDWYLDPCEGISMNDFMPHIIYWMPLPERPYEYEE